MNRILIIILSLSALAVVACTKQELCEAGKEGSEVTLEQQYPSQGSTVITAGIAEGTKVHTNASCGLYWDASDAIQVNGATSVMTAVNPENAAIAEFHFSSGVSYPYCAAYPANAVSGYNAEKGTATVHLSAFQTYTEGSFDPAAGILLGYAESGNLFFQTPVSYLRIKVSGGDDNDAIKSIRIRANDGSAMCGDFTAAFGAAACTLSSSAKDYTEITLTASTPVAQGTAMYLVIPAKSYPTGLNFFLVDANGHWSQSTVAKPFTASPGEVYDTAIQFNKNGDYQGVGIYTSHDWMEFALEADGLAPQSAECPVTSSGNGDYSKWKDANGVVNMYADINVPVIDWSTAADQRQGSITNWSTVLDAHGHTLSADTWRIAVFQNIYEGGEIRNLKVFTNNFSARSHTAFGGNCLLASYVIGGQITGCENLADLTCTATSHIAMSGICKGIYSGKIVNCRNKGNLTILQGESTSSCNTYIGGITSMIGKSLTAYGIGGNVEITGCVNEGAITIEQAVYKYPQCFVSVAGIAAWLLGGDASSHALIKDCENKGDITHITPTGAGALNTSSSVGGIIGIAYTPNKATAVPNGRTIGFMYGGAALNTSETENQDGFYFEMQGCVNRGKIENRHHVHGNVGSGTIRYAVIAGGLAGTAIGMKDNHAKVTACKNYGTVIAGNPSAKVARSFCNTVLGGLFGYAGSLDVDGCVFKGTLGDSTTEAYATGGVFGGILNNCKADNCKVYFDKLYYNNNPSYFYYYGGMAGSVSTWVRASGALAAYCSACSFSNNSFGGTIKAVCRTAPADNVVISESNVSQYFFNQLDAGNATVGAYPVSGTAVWDGVE